MNDPLYTIAYVSRATSLLDRAALREIERVSRLHNAARDISGVLILEGGSIAQVLEGRESELRRLMTRIERDPRHTDLRIFGENPIPVRVVGEWSMAVRDLSDAETRYRTPFQNLLEVIGNSPFRLELDSRRIETFRRIASLCA